MITLSKGYYGIKSQDKYELRRRAKRQSLTVDQLQDKEKKEQEFLDKGLRFCKTCSTWKEFGKGAAYCKSCCADKSRVRYNPKKERAYWLNKKFGITLEHYDGMRKDQNYKCYICQRSEDELDRCLAVDHCHTSGKVRGLLCGNCNRYLGQIADNIEAAKNLLSYLEKYK